MQFRWGLRPFERERPCDRHQYGKGWHQPAWVGEIGVSCDVFHGRPCGSPTGRGAGNHASGSRHGTGGTGVSRAVLAIGNAPTALFAIARQMERGQFPAMLIGVPVGFVNVEEAKEQVLALCRRFEVPAIFGHGTERWQQCGSGYLQCLALSGRGYAGPCRTRLAVKRKKTEKESPQNFSCSRNSGGFLG